ncbi:MAG: hypothetical protein KGH71_00185 [Candidatus Micrarchaeota archaeon]|nr:hypothetical protein [Candidatus Micrarchaeota archaeon]
MSNVKQKTPDEKKNEIRNIQNNLQGHLISYSEAKKELVISGMRELVRIYKELGNNVPFATIPAGYIDTHNNNAASYIRESKEGLVLATKIVTEHGMSRFILIEANQDGRIKIDFEAVEAVSKIFSEPETLDVSKFVKQSVPLKQIKRDDGIPAALFVVEEGDKLGDHSKEEITKIQDLFLDN